MADISELTRGEEGGAIKPLSPGTSQFVESMGMMMEKYGLARIGGRIMGLLMLTDTSLSLDDISSLLSVSRASISTNIRMSESAGLAVRVARPGDRRDYYVGADDMWVRALEANIRDILLWEDMARKALPNVPREDRVAHRRLQELIDFCEFVNARLAQAMDDWRQYKAKAYADIEDDSGQ